MKPIPAWRDLLAKQQRERMELVRAAIVYADGDRQRAAALIGVARSSLYAIIRNLDMSDLPPAGGARRRT